MAKDKTILIVDDDKEILQGLRMVLEGKGYRIITAPDGDADLHPGSGPQRARDCQHQRRRASPQ